MALKMHELTGQTTFESSEESDKTDEDYQLECQEADIPANESNIIEMREPKTTTG